VAQNTPARAQYQRVPIMDASMLDDRTKPTSRTATQIWLHHRLQPRGGAKGDSAVRRARAWLRQISGSAEE